MASKSKTAAEIIGHVALDHEIDTIVNSIGEASEELLSQIRATRTITEASSSEGIMELTRVWREVDVLMGPGKSTLQVLMARYGRLRDTIGRMNKLLRQGLKSRSKSARTKVLSDMEFELESFAKLKAEIAKLAEDSVVPLRNKLKAELGDELLRPFRNLTRGEVKAESAKALDEMERTLRAQYNALKAEKDGRPITAALEKRAEALVTMLNGSSQTGKRGVINARVKKLSDFGNPLELGSEFARKVKRRIGRALPALQDIEDSGVVFMEVLGVVAQARPKMTRLLRRYVEDGPNTLKKEELERVAGTLGNIRGILPEEVATRMGFLRSIFHKSAFEALADFPPTLRKQMTVEIVEGPLWVFNETGLPRQFGDGCVLLTSPDGHSAIVGIGEIKAGFDEALIEQLLVKSDRRAIVARVTFIGVDGKQHIRTLTREFTQKIGEPFELTKPPVYAYARPGIETVKTAEEFKQMVNDEMQSGRELWKIYLPFDQSANEQFVTEALRESVKILKKAKKGWGS